MFAGYVLHIDLHDSRRNVHMRLGTLNTRELYRSADVFERADVWLWIWTQMAMYRECMRVLSPALALVSLFRRSALAIVRKR